MLPHTSLELSIPSLTCCCTTEIKTINHGLNKISKPNVTDNGKEIQQTTCNL